jgi:hypothetical protein
VQTTTLRSELDSHLEIAEEVLRRRGYSMRAQRGIPALSGFALDVKLGVRMLRKSWGLTLTVNLAHFSASAFELTRVAPLFGRYLIEADEQPGAPPVVVLGHDGLRAAGPTGARDRSRDDDRGGLRRRPHYGSEPSTPGEDSKASRSRDAPLDIGTEWRPNGQANSGGSAMARLVLALKR